MSTLTKPHYLSATSTGLCHHFAIGYLGSRGAETAAVFPADSRENWLRVRGPVRQFVALGELYPAWIARSREGGAESAFLFRLNRDLRRLEITVAEVSGQL